MKLKIFPFLAILSMIACKNTDNQPDKKLQTISKNISFGNDGKFFILQSGKFQYKIPSEKLPLKRVILLNSSLVGYITALGLEGKIVGVSSPKYIYSQKIQHLLQQNKIQNVGDEQKYDTEKILSLKPDAVFTNHIVSFESTYDLLRKNGVKVIFIDEYLEQRPLEKSKIIEIFGEFFNCRGKSDSIYKEIAKNYQDFKFKAAHSKQRPIVITNEMYGSQWFLPGGHTFVASYLKDAYSNYILGQDTAEKAVPVSFEEVFLKSRGATFWVNAGNHRSKAELLSINPNYAKMNVFQHGKIYAVTAKEKGSANDFFEDGVVRADLVLKDYIIIFHPEVFPGAHLTYMEELK